MKCQEVERRLLEDSSARQERGLQEHLHSCPGCAQLCRELLSMEESWASLRESSKAPRGFVEGTRHRLRRESRRGAYRMAAVAACLLVAAVALTFWPPGDQTHSSDGTAVHFAAPRPPTPPLAAGNLSVEPGGADDRYVDVVVESPSSAEHILRLPSRIEVRRTRLHDDFYLSNISH